MSAPMSAAMRGPAGQTEQDSPQLPAMRAVPLARPSLVLLLLLCTSALALPGLSVTLPLTALFIAIASNYVFAYRHVSAAEFSLATPPLGRVGSVMVWNITTGDDPNARGGWLLVGASRRTRVPLVPGRPAPLPIVLDQRGIFAVAQLHLISTGPLFLPLHATRRVLHSLVVPLLVAPRLAMIPSVREAVVTARRAADGEESRGGDVPGGPESVRAFERGDKISSVHWPATARTGSIHVKQLERLGGSHTVTVVVDHIDGSTRGETILSEATWLLHALVADGYRIDLATSRARTIVTSTTQADEVLASVTPGEFLGTTGTAAHPHLGTVRVVSGQWCVDGVAIHPAGMAPPIEDPNELGVVKTTGNPPVGVLMARETGATG